MPILFLPCSYGMQSQWGNLPLGGATMAFDHGLHRLGLQYAAGVCDWCGADRAEVTTIEIRGANGSSRRRLSAD